MSVSVKSLLVCAACLCGLSSIASAQSKLTVRGGYAFSNMDYPYAFDLFDQSQINSDYGEGVFGHIGYSNDTIFGSFGGEVSFTYHRLTNSDSYSDGGRCTTYDIISLSHVLCMEGAETSSTTRFGQFRLMAKQKLAGSGLEIMGGIGVLDFSSDSSGMMFFPGESSSQSRSNDYTGVGLVVGTRKEFVISGATTLQLEGFAGAYTGDRDLTVNGEWVGNVGELSQTNSQTVYSLDLSASVAVPVQAIGAGSKFEFGLAYARIFNVMDTTNYNTTTLGIVGPTGSLNDDVDAFSVFVGLQIPM
ncbi:MAG: hypothetical protein AAGB07_06165 [Pseudomonadota bacterium]